MLTLTSLPGEVLKLVMQHVPLKDRLGSCCLVSRRLHAAAVAATDTLQLFEQGFVRGSVPTPRAESAHYWITHYGQHLRTVQLGGMAMVPLLQLPCPNLCELKLGRGCSVQLDPSSSDPGVIHGCPNLTRLELHCQVTDAGRDADRLSSLVHLQHLEVQAIEFDWVPTPYSLGGLPHAALRRLQHLTYLRFDKLSVGNLLNLSSLTSLQVLHFDVVCGGAIAVGPRSVAGMKFPTSLKVLCLLCPIEAAILSLVPTGLQDLQLDCDVEGDDSGPGSFLSCMARLQHLTSFVMVPDGGAMNGGRGWPLPCPAYSALTASSSLVRLQLHNPPGGIWQDVFPATRTLPHLTSLTFTPCDDGFTEQHPYGDSSDFASLVSCCPSLCSVDGVSVQHGVHVSELHKLTALTGVVVTYDDQMVLLVDETLRGLAQLTQLHFLRIMINAVDDLAPGRFLPLTSLTALTSLELVHSDPDGRQQEEEFRAKDPSHPDVWLQLLEHCAEDEDCPGCGWPTHLQGLVQQLVSHRDLAVWLQQQVSQQQAQLAAQQQLIADLQRQLAGQQQRDVLSDHMQKQLQELQLAQD